MTPQNPDFEKILQKVIANCDGESLSQEDRERYDVITVALKIASRLSWKAISSCPIDEEILVVGGVVYPEVGESYICSKPTKVITNNRSYFTVCDTDCYSCYVNSPSLWTYFPNLPNERENEK